MWDIIAYAVAVEAGKKKAKDNKNSKSNSKFGGDRYPHDKESRRDAQFKFFGYKPKRFISVYARKPRVRVKIKVKHDNSRVTNVNYNDSRTAYIDRQMAALYQQQMQMGNQQSAMAYGQGAAAQQAMGAAYGHGMLGLSSLAGLGQSLPASMR